MKTPTKKMPMNPDAATEGAEKPPKKKSAKKGKPASKPAPQAQWQGIASKMLGSKPGAC